MGAGPGQVGTRTVTASFQHRLAHCATGLMLLSPSVVAQHDELRRCLTVVEDAARLVCYDRAVHSLIEPRFKGRLSAVTEPFEVSGPTRMRFQSDGAIFVMYLRAADGAVVQNLHLGGGGEDSYIIQQAGRYSLHINGSEGWRIWLEPLAADSTTQHK